MIEKYSHVSRKKVEKARIAICPQFGCKHLEKVKPLKFGVLGFRKYPKCPKHKIYLVFVDEFIGNFIQAINACLFDISSLPPENLTNLIKTRASDGLNAFFNCWMYCNPIGRGAQIVSNYMDGLSRSYMKLLSRKQRKSLQNERNSKKHYEMLRSGLKKIADEYTNFIQNLHEKSEVLHDSGELRPFSAKVRNLIQTWLKDYLNEIHIASGRKKSESPMQDKSLSMLKKEYDKILHAGTCTLLLGKPPTIVTKGISAFELFSAYHEFLEAGLCRELKREDIQTTIKGKETVAVFTLKIPHFKQKIKDYIQDLISLIDITTDQKEFIRLKSLKILDEFISKAENNEFTIPKNVNLRLIATTIIYTVIISNKNMPRISMVQISKLANVDSNYLGLYYRKYFKGTHSKAEFLLSVYKLGRIRNYISLYFFEILKDRDIKTSDLVMCLKNNILMRINLPTQLTQKDLNTLCEIATQYQDKFVKYFSDLVEIIRNLIISSITHRKVGALLSLNPLVEYLRERNINLLQKGKLYNSIDNILNFLEEKFPNFFPIRWGDREKLSKKEKEKRDREYRRTVASKLKFYILKNIYNGKYFEDGIIKCPECVKEGLDINTNSLRLKSLECHHYSTKKENSFKSDNLYLLFNENRGNPNVLEKLINIMETEGVILLCKNHHRRLHFNNEFDYIVNWEDIFSLPSELIHLLVKVSLNSFRLTKGLSPNEKAVKKKNILRKIKKRYIIERFYGEYCHICGEFSIRKDLSGFDYHHQYEDPPNIKAHELYDTHFCSEIVKILIQEIGGYMCSNCHTVIQYRLLHLLDDIYEDKSIVKEILDDYNNARAKFKTMNNIKGVLIENPLEKSVSINETYERVLTAMYEISKLKREITISDLASFTGFDQSIIHKFFKKESEIIKQCIEIKVSGAPNPTKFNLTEKGKKFASLINHFKDYYASF